MNKDAVERWADEVLRTAQAIGADVLGLIRNRWDLATVGAVLTRIIQAAELVITGPGRGHERKAAVRAVLRLLDQRYHWRDALDAAIKLPKALEWADDLIMPAFESAAIELVVAVLNLPRAWSNFDARVIPGEPPAEPAP